MLDKMEYTKISGDIKKYVRKSTYIGMDKIERKLYIKMVKELKSKLDELEISEDTDTSDDEDKSRRKRDNKSYNKLSYRSITVVGMKFHGDHRFDSSDVIRLEKEDNNPKDSNAVKVMLNEGKKWKHKAYVCREDAMWLRTIDGFEKLPLELIGDSWATYKYTIDLRSLEDKGIKIKTKKDVIGNKPRKFYKREWCNPRNFV